MQSPTSTKLSPNEFPYSPLQQYDDSESDSDLSLTDYKDHLIQQHQSIMPEFQRTSSTASLPISNEVEKKHQDLGSIYYGVANIHDTTVVTPNTKLSSQSTIRRKPPPDLALSSQEQGENTESAKSEYKEDKAPSILQPDRKASRMKRLSTGKFNNWGKMVSSLSRSASMKTFERPQTEGHNYRKPLDTEPLPQAPIFESSSSNRTTTSTSPIPIDIMPFWKYHILRFGKDLYLTTNPGTKYIHCRNGPSFYVEILMDPVINQGSKMSGDEYTLIFKDPVNLSQDPRQCMMITKKYDKLQGYFKLKTPKNTYLADDGTMQKYEDMTLFKTVSFPLQIVRKHFPYKALREENAQFLTNYEVRDLQNKVWNVGSIPRVRVSRINKMRQTVMNANRDTNEQSEQEELKLVAKRNIYFHRNYANNVQDDQSETALKNLHDSNAKFPPVLSMFRPNENRITKRLVKSMKQQQKKRHASSVHMAIDDFESSQNDTKTFYNGSDGLYYLHDTRDDNPDENKLGWLTIYEDMDIFGGVENRGMFDIVLGMTLAVGFDTYLKNHMAMKR